MEVRFFSGYIRNANALCAELELPLSADRKLTEKEIILRGFERWGKALCDHLYGAFAFAIEDTTTNTLYCARDQFGIIPFFYHLTEHGKLLFSDDIREIANHKAYTRALNRQVLQVYLMLGYNAGTETLFKGIQKLPAGHWLIQDGNGITTECYYKLSYNPDYTLSEDEWMDEIERTALEIISEDKALEEYKGAESFLSGGVDSSYLLALSDLHAACSIGYENTSLDESQLARQTAELLKKDFRRRVVSPELYFDTLPKVIAAHGLPLADVSSVVFYLGCEDVAARTSLCFSGEGADEFFAGYWLYLREKELALDEGPLHLGCFGVTTQSVVSKLLIENSSPFDCSALVNGIYADTKDSEHLSRLLAIDVKLFLEGDIMFGLSRSSAAHNLQVRTPFADRRMFELSARIPSALKLHDGIGKYILRSAASRRLPQETAFRKKAGFSVPVCEWMRRSDIKALMEQTLFGDVSKSIFDQDLLRKFWTNFQLGNDALRSLVFAIYEFLIWYKMWF